MCLELGRLYMLLSSMVLNQGDSQLVPGNGMLCAVRIIACPLKTEANCTLFHLGIAHAQSNV
jgi:hypothetical protein